MRGLLCPYERSEEEGQAVKKYKTTEKPQPLVHVTVRVPVEILDYFRQQPSYTLQIRKVLEEYVKQQGGESDAEQAS